MGQGRLSQADPAVIARHLAVEEHLEACSLQAGHDQLQQRLLCAVAQPPLAQSQDTGVAARPILVAGRDLVEQLADDDAVLEERVLGRYRGRVLLRATGVRKGKGA